MTVEQTTNKSGPYNTDGSTVNWNVTFQYQNDSEILVQLLNTTTGIITPLIYNTDYTVTDNVSPIIGGVVTIQPSAASGVANTSGQFPSGYTLTITPNIQLTQEEDFPSTGKFPTDDVEFGLDRLTLIVQQFQNTLKNCLQIPNTDNGVNTTFSSAAFRAGMYLAFDQNGQPIFTAGTGSPNTTTSNQIQYILDSNVTHTFSTLDWGNDVERSPFTSLGAQTDGADSCGTMPYGWWTHVLNRSSCNIVITFTGGQIFESATEAFSASTTITIPPGERIKFFSVGNGNYVLLERIKQTRAKLKANLTLYVATTGSDSNNGYNVGMPFLTIQKAVNVAAGYDLNGFTITIQVADGTYTGGISVSSPFVNGMVNIQGDATTPSNCVISTTSNSCVSVTGGAKISMGGFKLTSATSGYLVVCFGTASEITFNNKMEYGATASGWTQLYAEYGGRIAFFASYTISGGSGYHYEANQGGMITNTGTITVTVTNTPAFGNAFANAYLLGMVDVGNITFSGSATGVRYNASLNGVVNTGGGGSTYFPGNSNGVTATGGQYA